MLQSRLFTRTRREAPKDEVSKNAILLIRAGYIHKEMAGVYSYLPLGLRVLEKVTTIIREEMNALGGQELFLSSLQDKAIWEKTNRWDDAVVDNWFKTKLKNGGDLGLGFTHEEPLTAIMKDHVRSFRDLPAYAYQFQTKFRNEARAKSGILRGREFIMKDLYSFSLDEKTHADFYEKAKAAYVRVFERAGLGAVTHITFASGGVFSKYSHEFQTVTPAGEDTIHVCKKCKTAVNEEIFAEQNTRLNDTVGQACPQCGGKDFAEEKAIEVGNIFNLGTRFSDALGLAYVDPSGKSVPVVMGSYGIGVNRLMGTIVEVFADDRGIVWPESVAPFAVHLILLPSDKKPEVRGAAEKLYHTLEEQGIEVLFDDRQATAGEKFADADLLGMPLQAVISEKTLAAGKIEVKNRKTGEKRMADEKELLALLSEARNKITQNSKGKSQK